MLKLETSHRDAGPSGDARGTGSPLGRLGLVPLLGIPEAGAALEREREQAAMEAQDILTQADEALVMG